MDELALIWQNVTNYFKSELTEMIYNTWIGRLEPKSLENDVLTIHAPNEFTRNMINLKYADSMAKYLKSITSRDIKIYVTDPSMDNVEVSENDRENFDISSDETNAFNKDDLEKRNDESMVEDGILKYDDSKDYKFEEIGLSDRYTFENFVAGKSNEFALSASIAVSKSPGRSFNPLFIYGGAGLGKTHLMHATAKAILERFPEKKVVYLSSESFTNELIRSINTRKNEEFRKKYRNIDVLLIDDIQFIAGKTGTQEEFFHTFNELYSNNKQIIISSDRPPKEIKTLEDRLVSRFEWGLIADIQKPDFETRVAILKNKVESEKIDIPEDVIEYIAMNVKVNIRELEGALLKVAAYKSLMKIENMNLDFAKEVLSKIISDTEEVEITIELIKNTIVSFYDLKENDLESKKRSKNIALPRQIGMYLSRKLTDLSLLKIASSFNRDHSTVIHGIDKIEDLVKTDNKVKDDIEKITEIIRSK